MMRCRNFIRASLVWAQLSEVGVRNSGEHGRGGGGGGGTALQDRNKATVVRPGRADVTLRGHCRRSCGDHCGLYHTVTQNLDCASCASLSLLYNRLGKAIYRTASPPGRTTGPQGRTRGSYSPRADPSQSPLANANFLLAAEADLAARLTAFSAAQATTHSATPPTVPPSFRPGQAAPTAGSDAHPTTTAADSTTTPETAATVEAALI